MKKLLARAFWCVPRGQRSYFGSEEGSIVDGADTEAVAVELRRVTASERGPRADRGVRQAPASEDTKAGTRAESQTVAGSHAGAVAVVLVPTPLPQVSVHVVQPERVRPEAPHRRVHGVPVFEAGDRPRRAVRLVGDGAWDKLCLLGLWSNKGDDLPRSRVKHAEGGHSFLIEQCAREAANPPQIRCPLSRAGRSACPGARPARSRGCLGNCVADREVDDHIR